MPKEAETSLDAYRNSPIHLADDAVTVDPVSCSVEHNGQEVPLKPRFFDVLLYFAERADLFASKNEAAIAIYGDDSVFALNSISVALSHSRKSFSDKTLSDPYTGVLRTRRGVGHVAAVTSVIGNDSLWNDKKA